MFDKLTQRKPHWAAQACQVLTAGSMLYGYCGGIFGRDSYGDKLILSAKVEGGDMEPMCVVLRVLDNGHEDVVVLQTPEEVKDLIRNSNNWSEMGE